MAPVLQMHLAVLACVLAAVVVATSRLVQPRHNLYSHGEPRDICK